MDSGVNLDPIQLKLLVKNFASVITSRVTGRGYRNAGGAATL